MKDWSLTLAWGFPDSQWMTKCQRIGTLFTHNDSSQWSISYAEVEFSKFPLKLVKFAIPTVSKHNQIFEKKILNIFTKKKQTRILLDKFDFHQCEWVQS